MAMSMPPPMLPSFSLRVQLYASSAYDLGDKPVRCFRVVTNPEATVRDFCQEASRIHEINYGHPLAVKKCQDDQAFDITQSEVIGSLFANTATIRLIQSEAHPSIRDSVPPSSALRFNPPSTAGMKRGRENGSISDGRSSSGSYNAKKRQRVSGVDPDFPIPSREESVADEAEAQERDRIFDIIPNSQESVMLGESGQRYDNAHAVRILPPTIAETPSVSPPPSALNRILPAKANADRYHLKHAGSQRKVRRESRELSLINEPTRREQELSSNKRRSTSYHIHGPAEGGGSVSTAATSPLSTDFQGLRANGIAADKWQSAEAATNPDRSSAAADHPRNGGDTSDSVASGDQQSTSRKAKRSTKTNGNTPGGELQEQKLGFNTPTPNQRRSRDTTSPVGELPLTPNSKRRNEQRNEASSTREVRLAGATAAERRKAKTEEVRKAEVARQEEHQKQAEEERAQKEEQERFEIEEFKRNEAVRLSKERQSLERRDARERKKAQDRKTLEEKANQVDRLAEERRKADEERGKEKAADGLRQSQQQKGQEKKQLESLIKRKARIGEGSAKKQTKHDDIKVAKQANTEKESSGNSLSPSEVSRRSKTSSSPELPRARPSVRGQSTTGFFPSARKSALKSTQSRDSSSPSVSRSRSSAGLGNEDHLPLPKSATRRVSFESHAEVVIPYQSIRPGTVTTAKHESTPKASLTTSSQTAASKSTTTPIVPPKPSYKRIVPPALAIKRSVSEVSNQSAESGSSNHKKTPLVNQESPRITTRSKGNSKSPPTAQPPPLLDISLEETASEYEESEVDESEDDLPSKSQTKRISPPKRPLLAKKTSSSAKSYKPKSISPDALSTKSVPTKRDEPPQKSVSRDSSLADQQSETGSVRPVIRKASRSPASASEEQDDKPEAENVSQASSRDSRSPVIYSQHRQEESERQVEHSSSPESQLDVDKDEADDTHSAPTDLAAKHGQEEASSEESDSGEDNEDTVMPDTPASPELPQNKFSQTKSILKYSTSGTNLDTKTSKTPSSSGSDPNTQDELDYQLTSSIYEANSTTHSHSPSLPPKSSTTARKLIYGARLSELNQNKKPISSPAHISPSNAKKRPQLSLTQGDDDSDQESEEDDDSDSEASETSASEAGALPDKTSSQLQLREPESEDSGSDSDSDSGQNGTSLSVDPLRNNLLSMIQGMNGSSTPRNHA